MAAGALPDFPWDTLAEVTARARAHSGGIVDLSVGTPVDPTPGVIRQALAAAADCSGYPPTAGTPELRDAVVEWFGRRRRVPDLRPDEVLPTLGSKEFVALLPSLLGLGPGDVVAHPQVAYPTYDVGARLAGATPEACADPAARLDADASGAVRLVWLNSPSNPDGLVASAAQLRAIVLAARAAELRHGRPVIVAADECYAELAWDEPWASQGVPSLLDPRVTGGDRGGLLAVYSLSKQSNLAGYRAAFVAGDRELVGRLLEVRKHAGFMVPGPVQAAMVAALGDDEHVAVQRARYARRRRLLAAAFGEAGYLVDGSHAGLYLWVRPAGAGQDSRATVADLAELGILAAPGAFYGPAGDGHVRVALTASDERIGEACARLAGA
ncbi:MAG: succinyldiaminopimelate transaminase [Micrococcales bacterium]|nr:succinyldiaminopimelate transaminase [Micrococcales bacterium]